MQSLTERGYAGTTWVVDSRTRKSIQGIVKKALNSKHRQRYKGKRVGYPINPETISAEQWKALFPKNCVQLLTAYLGGDPELLSTEVLEVPPNSAQQILHRDHRYGAGKSVCVSVNTAKGHDVGTLIIFGSHRAGNNTFDSALTTPCRGDWIVYDTYCIHAGPGNPSTQSISSRVFFTFFAPTLNAFEKSDLTRAMGFKDRNTTVKLSEVVSGAIRV